MNKDKIIRITKEFSFEMAHALYGYEGACKNIHGHSYCLSVCVKGIVRSNSKVSENGMVMDFSVLKRIVKTYVIDIFDHALLLNGASPHRELIADTSLSEKVILTDYQPSCENILYDIVTKVKPHLPTNIQLHHLLLRETATSYAEWYSEDN